MSIKIQNKSLNLKKQNNIVLFVNSNYELKELNNSPISRYAVSIKEMLNLNKKKIKDFLSFDLSAQIKITIIKITKDQKIQNNNDKLGAKFFEFIKTNSFQNNIFIDVNLKTCCKSNSNFFNEFLSGILIKSSLTKQLTNLAISITLPPPTAIQQSQPSLLNNSIPL